MDVRNSQMCRGGREPTLSLTAKEAALAGKYSPFRDAEPPNFLKYGRPRRPPTVRVYRKIVGDVIHEWRGHIPVGIGNYCPDEIEEVRI